MKPSEFIQNISVGTKKFVLTGAVEISDCDSSTILFSSNGDKWVTLKTETIKDMLPLGRVPGLVKKNTYFERAVIEVDLQHPEAAATLEALFVNTAANVHAFKKTIAQLWHNASALSQEKTSDIGSLEFSNEMLFSAEDLDLLAPQNHMIRVMSSHAHTRSKPDV
jgi:hypothetical protein